MDKKNDRLLAEKIDLKNLYSLLMAYKLEPFEKGFVDVLSDYMCVSNSTVYRWLGKLEKLGLVERVSTRWEGFTFPFDTTAALTKIDERYGTVEKCGSRGGFDSPCVSLSLPDYCRRSLPASRVSQPFDQDNIDYLRSQCERIDKAEAERKDNSLVNRFKRFVGWQ